VTASIPLRRWIVVGSICAAAAAAASAPANKTDTIFDGSQILTLEPAFTDLDWQVQFIADREGRENADTVVLFINEFMADNNSTIEDPDEPGAFEDWIEIHNAGTTSAVLGGMHLTDDLDDPTRYEIPAGVSIAPGGYLLFWADDDDGQGPLHTNFKLGASGEEIGLIAANGVTVIDSITFGQQFTDVSYGRYPEGTDNWDFCATPTPNGANGPHNPPPTITGTTHTPPFPTASDPVWVTSTVIDDSAVAGVTLTYDAGSGPQPVTMYDDGAHHDGAAGDDEYGGQIPAMPQGTIVDYYVTATDDLGAESTDPPSAPGVTYTYLIGYTPPPIYVNEFMADNETTIEDPDEPGEYPDWIELYNTSTTSVYLGGMYLTDDLNDPLKWQIPAGVSIDARGYLLFWADDDDEQGDTHANFKLDRSGEQIGFFETNANGNVAIDTLTFGEQATDVSYGRCPDGSDTWRFLTYPSPDGANSPTADFDGDCDVDRDDLDHFEACGTGPSIGPPGTGCQDADLDGDGDVDHADFGLFQRCLSGPGVPADPRCAD